MKRSTLFLALSVVIFAPLISHAQSVQTLIYEIERLITLLLPIMVSLGLLAFFWGLVKYLWRADNPDEAKAGKTIMLYGVLALFVMVSIWGIVIFIGRSLGISPGGSISPPTIQRGGSSGGSFSGPFNTQTGTFGGGVNSPTSGNGGFAPPAPSSPPPPFNSNP